MPTDPLEEQRPMGFMDKAKKLAEQAQQQAKDGTLKERAKALADQAQHKLDEVQDQFNERQKPAGGGTTPPQAEASTPPPAPAPPAAPPAPAPAAAAAPPAPAAGDADRSADRAPDITSGDPLAG